KRWANSLVYEACAQLSEDERRADKGAFFGSAHRTLNHLLAADRIWLKRLTGAGEAPNALDTILFDAFDELRAARGAEDQRIMEFVDKLDEHGIAQPFSYTPITNPIPV